MDVRSLLPFSGSSSPKVGKEDDPFALMRREMDRLFDSFSHSWGERGWGPQNGVSAGFLSPKVDVAETEKGLEVTAELPGIDQKDIELDLADGILTLKAAHKEEKESKDEKKHYHLVERSHGSFMRRLPVPFEPDADKVEASFEKGVLRVIVPRSAAAEKSIRKIAIKGS
jgi:HSP20 family protein